MGLTIVFCVVTAAMRLLIHSLWEADMIPGGAACLGLKGSYKIDSHRIYDSHRINRTAAKYISACSKQVSESTTSTSAI